MGQVGGTRTFFGRRAFEKGVLCIFLSESAADICTLSFGAWISVRCLASHRLTEDLAEDGVQSHYLCNKPRRATRWVLLRLQAPELVSKGECVVVVRILERDAKDRKRAGGR